MFPTGKLTLWPTFTSDAVTVFQKSEVVWAAEMLQSAHSRAEKWCRSVVLLLSLEEKQVVLLICFGFGGSNQAET